jgi:hypothetical protein
VLIPDLYKGKVGVDAEEASHVSAAAMGRGGAGRGACRQLAPVVAPDVRTPLEEASCVSGAAMGQGARGPPGAAPDLRTCTRVRPGGS